MVSALFLRLACSSQKHINAVACEIPHVIYDCDQDALCSRCSLRHLKKVIMLLENC